MLSLNIEEDPFIVSLAPVIFKVNLYMVFLQGKDGEEKCDSFVMNNHNKNYQDIYLLNIFNSNAIIYTKDYMEEISSICSIPKPDATINEKTVILVTGARCANCFKKKETIRFTHISNFFVCKACIQKYINVVILKRVKDFIKESLRNKECKI